MLEQMQTEKQCSRCMACKSTLDFRFRTNVMGYAEACRDCEGEKKAAKVGRPKQPEKWPAPHVAILTEHFPLGGTAACRELLPDSYSEPAIRAKAYSLELKYVGPRQQGSRPLDDSDVPIPAHDYCDTHRAWQSTRLPVYATGFGAAVIGVAL